MAKSREFITIWTDWIAARFVPIGLPTRDVHLYVALYTQHATYLSHANVSIDRNSVWPEKEIKLPLPRYRPNLFARPS